MKIDAAIRRDVESELRWDRFAASLPQLQVDHADTVPTVTLRQGDDALSHRLRGRRDASAQRGRLSKVNSSDSFIRWVASAADY